MNASERKALALVTERAAGSPWTTTHAEAALACGCSVSTWQRSLSALTFAGLVVSTSSRGHGLTLSVGPQRSPDTPATVMTQSLATVNGQPERIATVTPQRSLSDTCLARSFETTSLLVVGSKEETTNDEQTTVLLETARDPQVSATVTRNGHPQRSMVTPQMSPTDLCGRALDYAERCGRLEAENAYLRAALAQKETACPTPAPSPIPSTCAPPAGTRGSATESSERVPTVAPSSGTSSGPTSTRTATATAPATEPRPSAPPSAQPAVTTPAPLHPANYRGEIVQPLEPGTDPHEDERVFREVVCKDAGVTSEMAQDVELMRLRKDFPTFHRAVASYVLRVAKKGKPREPMGWLAGALGYGKRAEGYGEEGAVSSWEEIRKTWLPKAKAAPKNLSPQDAKAERERLAAEDQERCRVIAEARWAAEAERDRKRTEEWDAQERIRVELEAKNKARLVAQFTGEVAK